jgi:Terminase large subunit, T4likevirus-type, N-terminal
VKDVDIDQLLRNEQDEPLIALSWWAQADAALEDDGVRQVCIWMPRQSGKSQYLARTAVKHALQRRGAHVLVVTASEQQNQSIFHRKLRRPIERMVARLGIRRKDVLITRRSIEFIELGSKIEVIPTSEATVPGRSVTLLQFDEGRDVSDEVYSSLIPSVIASGGKILVASTAGRPRGFFFAIVTTPDPETRVITAERNMNPYASSRTLDFLGRILARVSPGFAARELRNEFADDAGTALIEAVVDGALGELPGSPAPAFAFLDLSRTHDLTSLAVVIRETARRAETQDHLVVASLTVWDPRQSPTGETDFEAVRAALGALPTRFPKLETLLIDEGAESGAVLPFCRSHAGLSLRVQGFKASVDSNAQLWGALAARIHARTVSLPRHPRLLEELLSLRQEAFAFGARWRVVDSSKRLHRDVSLAVAGAVYAAGEAGPPAIGGTLESFAATDAERAAVAETPGGFFGRIPPSLMRSRAEREKTLHLDDEPRSRRSRGFFFH